MEFVRSENIYHTLYRKGKKTTNKIEIIWVNSSLFNEKVILMSDLHSEALRTVQQLQNLVKLKDYIVLSVGDMAGTSIAGVDADPTQVYEFLAKEARAFYFVQGNHDIPDPNGRESQLTNADNSKCWISNGQIVNTPIGKIGGINGIISNKKHPYKLPENVFYGIVKSTLKQLPDIFLSHETPQIPGNIGQYAFFKIIEHYTPLIHIFGHCHHGKFHTLHDGTNFINADARVLIISRV